MANSSPRSEAQQPLLPAPLALVLILAAFLLVALRATESGTIWIDETYTILNAQLPMAKCYVTAQTDTHPPAYYFVLHLAIKAAALLGIGESPFVARIPGMLLWWMMVGGMWAGLRTLGMRRLACAGAVVVAWSPVNVGEALFIRGYGLATVPLTIAMILLLRQTMRARAQSPFASSDAVAWSLYTICVAVALWTHPLSALVAFLLGVFWLTFLFTTRPLARGYLVAGFIAHSLAAASFLPWLTSIPSQIVHQPEGEWMTPRTFPQFLGTFIYWLPYFHVQDFTTDLVPFGVIFGAASLIIPVLLWWNFGRGDERARYGWMLLFLCFVYVEAIFLLHAFDIAHTFFPPRYAALVGGIWLFGLLLLSSAALEQSRGALTACVIVVLGIAICGNFMLYRTDHRRGFGYTPIEFAGRLPPPGSTIYCFTPSLIPYSEAGFPGRTLLPARDIVFNPPKEDSAHFFDLNFWTTMDSVEDQLLKAQISAGLLSSSKTESLKVFRVDGLNRERLALLKERECRPNTPVLPPSASTAVAAEQRYGDGFSMLEVDAALDACLWSRWQETRIRFDRPVPAGKYRLSINLYRAPYPREQVSMEWWFEGEEPRKIVANSGAATLQVEVDLTGGATAPVLHLTHPMWSPKDFIEGNGDWRKLGYLFHWATLERLP